MSRLLTLINSKELTITGFEIKHAATAHQDNGVTLESGLNIALCLLIFWLFSRGYGLIPDSIEPILVV